MKRPYLLLAALLLVGAGCASDTKTDTYGYSTDEGPAGSAATDAGELTVPAATPTTPKNDAMDKQWTFPGTLPENQIKDRQIRMQTDKGEIVFELFEEDAPIAVSNFIYLTKGGFYDGIRFHRREEGFVIQGGDPLTRDMSRQEEWGTGGPGYRFQEEPVTRPYERGIVAMAKTPQPGTTGSQFFIMLADVPLPPEYTIIGKVTKGMDVVDKISIGDVMTSVVVEAESK